jgi:putative transposase
VKKSRRPLRQGREVAVYELIHAERATFPIALSCRALEVSRSGYYRWRDAEPSARATEDATLLSEIRGIHREHKGRYGSPRVHRELRENGRRTSRKRVARLMREEGLRGWTPRRFRRTTDSRHSTRIAPNLLERDFSATGPNEVWVGDMTYVWTSDGWVYLAVLLDLFSRRLVGWAMSDQIDTHLALSALEMAVREREPKPGLVHHTDRDCRYASDDYQAALDRHGLIPSMSRKADCWDNAVAESVFATLEKELLADQPVKSREETRAEISDYIENYYNVRRRHSYLDYATPVAYELAVA